MLDHLIDDTNIDPKQGMEYIYRLDMAWYARSSPNYGTNGYGDFPMKEGTIMIDVVKLDNNSFDFTCKETGDRLHTNYGWALAENTKENRERIKQFEIYDIYYKEIERIRNKLLHEIITLKPTNDNEEIDG